MNKAKLLGELQMLTGLLSNDYEYMLYMLLKDGSRFKEVVAESKFESSDSEVEMDAVQCLDSWFNSLMEVENEE